MQVFNTPLEQTGYFGKLFLNYIQGTKDLKDFYRFSPDINSFNEAIDKRKFDKEFRVNLVNVLNQQYNKLNASEAVKSNLEKLSGNNTYTVTTGHQLNLATGPLYFIYKILTTINLTEKLKNSFPDKDFVPVFWMASEDHDLDEIRAFKLFGKEYKWESDQKGPVGRMFTTGLEEILNQLPERFEQLEKAYSENKTLSEATRILVNELFGKYGLIIIDPDNAILKKQFQPVLENELFSGKAGENFQRSTNQLKSLDFDPQVFPRELNLFLFHNSERKRLVKEGNVFKALPDAEFSEDEVRKLLENNPECFSPNVLMRPLYQECILPNLAYIGGAAEIDYWLQMKSAFDAFDIPFPVLLPRNFLLYVDKNTSQKFYNLHLKYQEILKSVDDLKVCCLQRRGIDEITIDQEVEELKGVFEKLKNKAGSIDKSLEAFVLAEGHKLIKDVGNIEKRLKKAQDQKHETVLRQVEKLKEKLFPGNKLQERSENIFSFLANEPDLIEKIKTYIDPFDFSFKVIADTDE